MYSNKTDPDDNNIRFVLAEYYTYRTYLELSFRNTLVKFVLYVNFIKYQDSGAACTGTAKAFEEAD